MKFYKPVKYGTFESGDYSAVTAQMVGTLDGEPLQAEFDHVNHQTIVSAIKGLFSDANSDTFLSAVYFVEKILLSKANPEKPEDIDARIPDTEEEIESMRFSYEQVKDNGIDKSPAVSWSDILAKLETAERFEMVETAPRSPRTSKGKKINVGF